MGNIALHTKGEKTNTSPIPSYVSYGKPKGVMARAFTLTQATITNAMFKTFAMGNLHHNLKVIKVCMHEILEKLMPKHWKEYNHNRLLSRIDPRRCTQMQRHKAYPIYPIKVLEIRRLIILYKISRPFWLWRFNQWFHIAFSTKLPCCYKLYLRVLCLNSWRCYTFGLGQTF